MRVRIGGINARKEGKEFLRQRGFFKGSAAKNNLSICGILRCNKGVLNRKIVRIGKSEHEMATRIFLCTNKAEKAFAVLCTANVGKTQRKKRFFCFF